MEAYELQALLQWVQRTAVPVPALAEGVMCVAHAPRGAGGGAAISSLRSALHPLHLLQLLIAALPPQPPAQRAHCCSPHCGDGGAATGAGGEGERGGAVGDGGGDGSGGGGGGGGGGGDDAAAASARLLNGACADVLRVDVDLMPLLCQLAACREEASLSDPHFAASNEREAAIDSMLAEVYVASCKRLGMRCLFELQDIESLNNRNLEAVLANVNELYAICQLRAGAADAPPPPPLPLPPASGDASCTPLREPSAFVAELLGGLCAAPRSSCCAAPDAAAAAAAASARLSYADHAALYSGELSLLRHDTASRLRLWSYLLACEPEAIVHLGRSAPQAAAASQRIAVARRVAGQAAGVEEVVVLLHTLAASVVTTFLVRRKLLRRLVQAGVPPQFRGLLWLHMAKLTPTALSEPLPTARPAVARRSASPVRAAAAASAAAPPWLQTVGIDAWRARLHPAAAAAAAAVEAKAAGAVAALTPSPGLAAALDALTDYDFLTVLNARALRASSQLPPHLAAAADLLADEVDVWQREGGGDVGGGGGGGRGGGAGDFALLSRGRRWAPAPLATVRQLDKDLPRTLPHLPPLEASRVCHAAGAAAPPSVHFLFARSVLLKPPSAVAAAAAAAAPPQFESAAHGGGAALRVAEGSLRRLLLAFSSHSPVLDFVQGLPFVAAHCLRWLAEPDAFALLTALLHAVLPPDYYAAATPGIARDHLVLEEVLTSDPHLRPVLAHLHALCGGGARAGVMALVQSVTLQWFVCLFAAPFSPAATDRLWDALLFSGDEVLFRATVAVLRLSAPRLLAAAELHEAMGALRACHTLLFHPAVFAAVFDAWVWPLSPLRFAPAWPLLAAAAAPLTPGDAAEATAADAASRSPHTAAAAAAAAAAARAQSRGAGGAGAGGGGGGGGSSVAADAASRQAVHPSRKSRYGAGGSGRTLAAAGAEAAATAAASDRTGPLSPSLGVAPLPATEAVAALASSAACTACGRVHAAAGSIGLRAAPGQSVRILRDVCPAFGWLLHAHAVCGVLPNTVLPQDKARALGAIFRVHRAALASALGLPTGGSLAAGLRSSRSVLLREHQLQQLQQQHSPEAVAAAPAAEAGSGGDSQIAPPMPQLPDRLPVLHNMESWAPHLLARDFSSPARAAGARASIGGSVGGGGSTAAADAGALAKLRAAQRALRPAMGASFFDGEAAADADASAGGRQQHFGFGIAADTFAEFYAGHMLPYRDVDSDKRARARGGDDALAGLQGAAEGGDAAAAAAVSSSAAAVRPPVVPRAAVTRAHEVDRYARLAAAGGRMPAALAAAAGGGALPEPQLRAVAARSVDDAALAVWLMPATVSTPAVVAHAAQLVRLAPDTLVQLDAAAEEAELAALAPAVDALLRAVPPQVQRALLWRERLAATSDFIACRRAFFCALATLPGVGPPPLPPVLAPGGLMALTSPADELHSSASTGWDSDSDRGAEEDAGGRDAAASDDDDGDGGDASPPHSGAALPEDAALPVAVPRLDGSVAAASPGSPAPAAHRPRSNTGDVASSPAWRAAAAGADGDPLSDAPSGGLIGSVWHVARMEVDEHGRRLGRAEPSAQSARLLETWYAAGLSAASNGGFGLRDNHYTSAAPMAWALGGDAEASAALPTLPAASSSSSATAAATSAASVGIGKASAGAGRRIASSAASLFGGFLQQLQRGFGDGSAAAPASAATAVGSTAATNEATHSLLSRHDEEDAADLAPDAVLAMSSQVDGGSLAEFLGAHPPMPPLADAGAASPGARGRRSGSGSGAAVTPPAFSAARLRASKRKVSGGGGGGGGSGGGGGGGSGAGSSGELDALARLLSGNDADALYACGDDTAAHAAAAAAVDDDDFVAVPEYGGLAATLLNAAVAASYFD